MRNRPIVVRLRPYTSTRTWVQLQSLTKQGVIGAFIANSDPLTADELEQLDKWGKIAFNFLKNEWLMAQKDDFIQNRYLPAFRAAINPSMSSYTVKQVYDYTISEGVLEATAKLIHKEAVSIYHGELNG